MNKINLGKLKADAEAATPGQWESHPKNPCSVQVNTPLNQTLVLASTFLPCDGTHIVNFSPENALILIEAVKRAAFVLNELCACDVDTDRCDACRTLDFMREQIDFGGGET